MTIIFIGAIFVVVGGIIGAIGTFLHNRASSEKSDKQLEKIGLLGEQNSDLALKLAEARAESFQNTYGSKNVIFLINSGAGIKFPSILNRSELPAYDVHLSITNYNELLKCEKVIDVNGNITVYRSCFIKNTVDKKISLLYGAGLGNIEDYFIDVTKNNKFQIHFHTKGGSYIQQYIYTPQTTAFRILKSDNALDFYNQLLQDVPDSRPFITETYSVISVLNQTGKAINWESEFPLPPGLKFAEKR